MGSAASAQAPDPPKSGNVAATSPKAMSFRRPRLRHQKPWVRLRPGAIHEAGALERREEGSCPEESIFSRHGSAKKHGNVRHVSQGQALPGRPLGGETGGWAVGDSLRHWTIQSRLRRPLFVASCRASPMADAKSPKPPRLMRCGHE